MANEVRVTSSLIISKGSFNYQSLPQSFTADLTDTFGPTPGAMEVPVDGINVDLSLLADPGFCRIVNHDATNSIEFGVYDPETDVFYPIGEVAAGESYVFRLSRYIGEEHGTAGTGTIGPDTNQLRLRALVAACNASVEAFDR